MKQLSLSTNRMIEKPWDYVGLTLPNGGYLEDEKEVLSYASSIGHDEFVDFNDEDVTPNNIDWVLEEGIFKYPDDSTFFISDLREKSASIPPVAVKVSKS